MNRQHFARRTITGGLLAIALFVGQGSEGTSPGRWLYPPQDNPPTSPADPIITLNDVSRVAYRRAREEALTRTGPIILVEGDNLVLKYGIQRTEVRFTPNAYHTLKSISHVPLGIYSLLVYAEEGQIGAARLYDLRQYRAAIAEASKALEAGKLPPLQRERQLRLLKACHSFIDGAIKEQRQQRKKLEAFIKEVRPWIEENTEAAARIQIDALHRQVAAWRGNLTKGEWDRLLVVVMGTQLPRKDNLAVQYFARLLGEEGEGKRIIYAEALFEESAALNLVGTRLLDTCIGGAFFDDPQRMHRDLLADAARKYLAELFKKGQ